MLFLKKQIKMSKQKNIISEEDELILQAYYMGWNDCPNNDKSNSCSFDENSILKTAYSIGWSDYITGDDVSSVDCQSDKEILESIKNIHNSKN